MPDSNSDADSKEQTSPHLPALTRRLIAVSSLRVIGTGFALAVLIFTSFLIVTAIEQVSVFEAGPRSIAGLSLDAWAAFVISLFAWAFLSANELAGRRNREDVHTLAPKLAGLSGEELLRALEPTDAHRRAGWIAVGVGAVVGAVIVLAQRTAVMPERGWFEGFTLVAWWALIATMILASLVLRWAVMARGETTQVPDSLLDQAKLDLLSPGEVQLVGHIALRGALVWLLHAAILCLMFVGQPLNAVLVATFLAIVAIAVFVFLTPLRWVHRLISRTKQKELAKIREDIRRARRESAQTGEIGARAGSRLAGLLAYEARIDNVSEWAIDVGTVARFVGLLSLPIISWTGGAFAERIIDWLIP